MGTARRWSRAAILLAGLAAWFCFAALPARAQDSKLADGPPPPPSDESAQPAPAPPPQPAPVPAAAPASTPVDPASAGPARPEEPTERTESTEPTEPAFDPVGAGRSVDVGTFYLKKGNYDAAIDRFQDAAQRQPKLAKPYLLMGEAYEKKNDPASAITAYRKYLELLRTAPDADKINKRIEKLEAESKHETAGH
jgi:tetratricopeptide (TPR) repeat protein